LAVSSVALDGGRPRTADATVMTDCELIVIERRDFIPFLRSQPDLMMQIVEILLLTPALDHRAGPGRELSRPAEPARQDAAAFGRRK
jgi:hypothetical protein